MSRLFLIFGLALLLVIFVVTPPASATTLARMSLADLAQCRRRHRAACAAWQPIAAATAG